MVAGLIVQRPAQHLAVIFAAAGAILDGRAQVAGMPLMDLRVQCGARAEVTTIPHAKCGLPCILLYLSTFNVCKSMVILELDIHINGMLVWLCRHLMMPWFGQILSAITHSQTSSMQARVAQQTSSTQRVFAQEIHLSSHHHHHRPPNHRRRPRRRPTRLHLRCRGPRRRPLRRRRRHRRRHRRRPRRRCRRRPRPRRRQSSRRRRLPLMRMSRAPTAPKKPVAKSR